MKFYRYIIVFFLGLALSCISPLDIRTERDVTLLVVEGYITTLPGPYTIQITKTARYGSVFEGVVKPETGADVWIKDEQGITTFLIDLENGGYQTPPGFRGVVGKTYVLNIITKVGIHYASLPETIQPVPEVESIYFEYKKQPTSDPLQFTSGMEVYAIWPDPPDETNFYIWRNSGVFYIKTFPENYLIPGQRPQTPAPKDCCDVCWVSESNSDYSIRIHKDDNTNGMVNTQLIAFIEDDGSRFTNRYQISIEQLSITKEAYQFFNLLKNQKSINGDIFDPPPATIRGNIINLDDPESNAIGYFHASDGTQITGFIERSELGDFQPLIQVNDDCRLVRGATPVKPIDWD